MKRTVKDVMTTDVVSVHTSTPYKEIVRLLEVSGVSALPVLDDADRLIGIISEADLLLKEEHQGEKHHRLELAHRRVERDKAEGTHAWQIMTAPVVTTSPAESIAGAARAMHEHHVKRLPVVDGPGALVGIVSRRDLLSVFMRADEEIKRDVVHDVIERTLWLTPEEANVQVRVDRGVVQLQGQIDRKSMVEILLSLVEGVEGVVGVKNGLSYQQDDTHLRPYLGVPWGVLPYPLRRP
jgi:CBS domain-containing protein